MKAVNVVVLGEPGVGKTAIMHRMINNLFEPRYLSTLGVRVRRKDYSPRISKACTCLRNS